MARTLRVFEHGRLGVGEGDEQLRQSELDALIKFNDANGGQYFEVGHKHIRWRQFVGYIEVGRVSIEILPKADRDAPQAATVWRDGLIEMLHVALGLRLEQHPSAAQDLARNQLLDLIAQAYLAELEPLMHQGLAKGYRAEQSNGSVFRGRLRISDHIRENVARGDRFFVEYQTFDHDILVNQLLAAALHALSWCALSSVVAHKVDETLARFPEVKPLAVTSALFERVRLTRATQRYASALVYARMILAQQGPQLQSGRDRVFALLFDMNRLWERYIAVLLRRAAPEGIRINTQERHDFWKPRQYAVRPVRPDIVVRAETKDGADPTLLVIDTKWKVPRNGQPSDEDLKQMFVYNELLGTSRSLLLYPATSAPLGSSGTYATKQHGCEQASVGLFEDARWSSAAIKAQLAALLPAV